jgi:lipoate-protein ligase A
MTMESTLGAAAPRVEVSAPTRHTVVLGCAQRRLLPEVASRLPAGVGVRVRGSGGGAVLAGPGWAGAVIRLPLGHPWLEGSLVEAYRRCAEAHVAFFADLGLAVRAIPPGAAPAPDGGLDWACFGGFGPWELADAKGRKLAGFAQRRTREGAVLGVGLLLAPVAWALLCEAFARPQDEPLLRARTVSLSELNGAPIEPQDFVTRWQRCLERVIGLKTDVPQPLPMQREDLT